MSKREKGIDKSKIITSIISVVSIVCFMYFVNLNYKRTYINEINNVEQNQAVINNNVNNQAQIGNTTEQNQTSQNSKTEQNNISTKSENSVSTKYDLSDIPEYTDKIWIEINNNIPYFTAEDMKKGTFEEYSELDEKERCKVAFASICEEIMPKEGQKREINGYTP